MKYGLVLEGGAMRGMYTAGALDALAEHNVAFDYCIGVSAGACNGVSFVSGQTGRNLRINQNYIEDRRYLGVGNFLRTKSMFGMDFIFDEIPNRLDPFDYAAFQTSPMAFVAGVTDVETGLPVYFDKSLMGEDNRILRASSAIPVFSPMVEIGGRFYLDGGTSDPIPVHRALEEGCDQVVVVLTRERGFHKNPEGFRRLYHRMLRRYPKMIDTLDRRHEIYNETLDDLMKLEQQGVAVVIAPETSLGVGRFEKSREKLKEIYLRGFADLESRLTDILDMRELAEKEEEQNTALMQ